MLLFFFSCKKDYVVQTPPDPCDNSVDGIYIRVANKSQYDFTEILLDSKGFKNSYDDLKSGEVSEYKKYDSAFSIISSSLKINDSTNGLPIIDYVGAKLLCNNYYTYELSDNPNQGTNPNLKLWFIFKHD